MRIKWINYMKRKTVLRGFDPDKIEDIIRYSSEKYADAEMGRYVAIGRHNHELVLVAYEVIQDIITPVTVYEVKGYHHEITVGVFQRRRYTLSGN